MVVQAGAWAVVAGLHAGQVGVFSSCFSGALAGGSEVLPGGGGVTHPLRPALHPLFAAPAPPALGGKAQTGRLTFICLDKITMTHASPVVVAGRLCAAAAKCCPGLSLSPLLVFLRSATGWVLLVLCGYLPDTPPNSVTLLGGVRQHRRAVAAAGSQNKTGAPSVDFFVALSPFQPSLFLMGLLRTLLFLAFSGQEPLL